MNWNDYKLSAIRSGTSPDGTKLFVLFLRDVAEKLGIKTPNAACGKCLNDYHNRLKMLSQNNVEQMSKYKLLSKREGISLEFGSQIHVTNANLTDEYAEILIKRFKKLNKDFKMSDLFETYPTETQKKDTGATDLAQNLNPEGSKSIKDIKPLIEKKDDSETKKPTGKLNLRSK